MENNKPTENIDTGGGVYVGEDVNAGKDFIGRDRTTTITHTIGTIITNRVSGNLLITLFAISILGIIAGLAIIFSYPINIVWMPRFFNGVDSIPHVKIQPLKVVDIRSLNSLDEYGYESMISADATIILRITYINNTQPAPNAFLEHEKINLKLGDFSREFSWQYFVNIHPDKFCWTCIEESVSAKTVASGATVSHETLFICDCELSWKDFLTQYTTSTDDIAIFKLTSSIDGIETGVDCTVDMAKWRPKVFEYIKTHNEQLPGRITMECV